MYVELIQKRQAALNRTKQEIENNEDDAVLQGKIVEIVFHNAQATIQSKSIVGFVSQSAVALLQIIQYSFVHLFGFCMNFHSFLLSKDLLIRFIQRRIKFNL